MDVVSDLQSYLIHPLFIAGVGQAAMFVLVAFENDAVGFAILGKLPVEQILYAKQSVVRWRHERPLQGVAQAASALTSATKFSKSAITKLRNQNVADVWRLVPGQGFQKLCRRVHPVAKPCLIKAEAILILVADGVPTLHERGLSRFVDLHRWLVSSPDPSFQHDFFILV